MSYDPDSRLAAIAAIMYGLGYVPGYDMKQFVGAPAPPRFGPPAPFQHRSLPSLSDGSWKPTHPPRAPLIMEDNTDKASFSDFVNPLKKFNLRLYDALLLQYKEKCHKLEGDGYDTEEVDKEELMREWKGRRFDPFPPRRRRKQVVCQSLVDRAEMEAHILSEKNVDLMELYSGAYPHEIKYQRQCDDGKFQHCVVNKYTHDEV
ncbi:hypothetical protein DXG01_013117 [Tephrocybe rancida]|nr:hypothetical protein DXG01_013117 [Tephrocybe rancida]